MWRIPWLVTYYCFFNDKFVSGLQLVCLTRYAVDIRHVSHTMVGDLWPQIIVFLMASSCPGCNFFVLWDKLLILDMWVDYLKMMCGVHFVWWHLTLNFDLNRLLALAIVYPHTKVDEYALRNVRFRVGTRLLRIH
jgi:hypothetical protein